jgi:hypothetical protein
VPTRSSKAERHTGKWSRVSKNRPPRSQRLQNLMDPYKRLAVAVLESAVIEYQKAHRESLGGGHAPVTAERRDKMEGRMVEIEKELTCPLNPWVDYSGLDGQVLFEALKKKLRVD